MRHVLVSLLLVAMSSCAPNPPPPDLSDAAAWHEACTRSRYDCKGIQAPMVRESPLVASTGAKGMFIGGHTVWLMPGMVRPERYVVLVHESVHYLQARRDEMRFPHSAFENCLREEEAYEVSDRVIRRLGLPMTQNLEHLRTACAQPRQIRRP